ncbi:MAG: apolipoprotein N-acyltransferase [Candidatus Binatia bacterium]
MRPNWRTGGDLALLILGTCLYTLASPPYNWSGAAWIALAPLFLVVRGKTPGQAFVAGLFYGILFCVGIAHWVYDAISAYFPLPFPLDALCTLLSYSVFVGAYVGGAAAGSCVLMRRGSPLLRFLGIPALWVIGEFARSTFLSGFSWELLGYTQHQHLLLIQIADISGVYGLSFLLAFSGYLVAEIVSSCQLSQRFVPRIPRAPFPWLALYALAAGVTIILGYGAFRLKQEQSPSAMSSIKLALVQGNIPNEQRWRRVHYARTLLQYAAISQQGTRNEPPDLVVWPEFALGFYPDKEPPLRAHLSQLTRQLNAPLLFGAPRTDESDGVTHVYNSAYLLAHDGTLVGVYDKTRLLPFAEAWPAWLPPLLPHTPELPTDFTAGDRSTIFPLRKGAFGVLICYEVTYPSLARRLVQEGAHFLVNPSNESWLGGEAAAAQHFSMAVFRAVENRRFLARAATAGVSGFIDPFGRPYQLSARQEGVAPGAVFPRHELTIYTRYGDWFIFLCIGFSLFALLHTHGVFFRAAHNIVPAPDSVLATAPRWDRSAIEGKKP